MNSFNFDATVWLRTEKVAEPYSQFCVDLATTTIK